MADGKKRLFSLHSNPRKRRLESSDDDKQARKRRNNEGERIDIKPEAIEAMHGPRPENDKKNWSQSDDIKLLKHEANGKTIDQLMRIFNRTREAIEQRLFKLKAAAANKRYL